MVQLNNYARKIGINRDGTDRYEWKVFIDEDKETLNNIDHVEYLLHPTFPHPRRVVHNREGKFALRTRGWGEFTIKAMIFFKDETKERVAYELDFEKPWPSSNHSTG